MSTYCLPFIICFLVSPTVASIVIEDVQTSYRKEYGGNEADRNDSTTAMGYFKSLVDGVNWEEFRGGYDPTYLDQNIKSIAFYHNMIAIKKESNREGSHPQK
jgi:hypothetical protein